MTPNRLVSALLGSTMMIGVGSPANADFVVADDLIVQGSECLGFDCVNGESFGFDTLRLKENNLRIHFDDTSVGAFPTENWRITINDSASGGLNKFAISDEANEILKLEANAPANSLVVDDAGRLGLKTANPVLEIHAADNDTPSLRMEQTAAGGFSAQTWDIAGNEANFFIRDVTGGSRLPFRVRPGAPTSSLDIANDGDVGLGTSSPQAKLHVTGGDGSIRLATSETNSTDKSGFLTTTHFTTAEEEIAGIGITSNSISNIVRLGGGSSAFNAATFLVFHTANSTTALSGNERMRIDPNGDVMIARTAIDPGNILQIGTNASNGNGAFLTEAGIWTDGSSRVNKININALDEDRAIEALARLEPVTYNGRQNAAETYVGFIAEDVPSLVAMNGRKGVAAIEISAVLTKVVQAQSRTVKSQQERIDALEARLARLETLIENGPRK